MENKGLVTSFKIFDGNTVKLEYRDTLPNTAELARAYAKAGYPDRYAVMTERQTTSPIIGTKLSEKDSEEGVFISCILRPSIFPSQAGLLGPLAAVAFATALEEHAQKKISIGWVKDIFCEGEKIGGVALEGKLDDYTSYEYLIVSFAVKLNKKDFPPRLTDMVRQVFETDNHTIGTIIAKSILNRFFTVYRDLKNPSKHMDVYKNKFALTGKKIKYLHDDKKITVRVMGIDKETCTLVTEDSKGEVIRITKPSSVSIPKKI